MSLKSEHLETFNLTHNQVTTASNSVKQAVERPKTARQMYRYHEPYIMTMRARQTTIIVETARWTRFNAGVLTKPVKIDQSEGVPDPGIPEQPFV